MDNLVKGLQCWKSISRLSKALEDFDGTKYSDVSQPYNGWLTIQKGAMLQIDDTDDRASTNFVDAHKKGIAFGSNIVEGYVIKGGCGYGSSIDGFLSSDKNVLNVRIISSGGHWVKAILRKDSYHTVECDDFESEMCWEEKTAQSRAKAILENLKK